MSHIKIQFDVLKINPGALVEFFTLDATNITDADGNSGGVLCFHAGTNELGGNVVWQGETYMQFPVSARDFGFTSSGTQPRPILSLSDAGGLLGAEARKFGYFLGAPVYRKRTFVKYLDAVNFANGNPYADPTVVFSEDKFFVDRKSLENFTIIEWELVSGTNVNNKVIPGRAMLQRCSWQYRGDGCRYAGAPVAKYDNTPTTDPAKDSCSHNITGCRLRYGTGALPYGGFPAVGMLRS